MNTRKGDDKANLQYENKDNIYIFIYIYLFFLNLQINKFIHSVQLAKRVIIINVRITLRLPTSVTVANGSDSLRLHL